MADPQKPVAPREPQGGPEAIPAWQEPPGSLPEPGPVTEGPSHVDIPPWQEPPSDPDHETVQVLIGEFAGREMRFPKEAAAAAVSDGWAKRFGDPDPQFDAEAQVKARQASHEAIAKLRQPKAGKDQPDKKQPAHQTREMQSGKPEDPYRTRTGPTPRR